MRVENTKIVELFSSVDLLGSLHREEFEHILRSLSIMHRLRVYTGGESVVMSTFVQLL
jgi:hypothetical protein